MPAPDIIKARLLLVDDDRTFLLEQINARLDLDAPLTTADIIAERCGVRPLVVSAKGGRRDDVDWTALSRKHHIEVDRDRRAITVFGGKLTDCLNVGEEVGDAVEALGLPLEADNAGWYGEPAPETRACPLYTSPSPRHRTRYPMPSSA